MGFELPSFIRAIWTRDKSGENFYDIKAAQDWGTLSSNLSMAQNHPILTPAMLFMSKLFSQAKFTVENEKTKQTVDHPILMILKDPNFYQTKSDFLESTHFFQVAQGKAVVYVKRHISLKNIEAIYLLDSDLIDWPEGFIWPKGNRAVDSKIKAKQIVYDIDDENITIKIGDLLFLYDLPNILKKNPFETSSRLDGLRQTLINTNDSLLAKNIILKTNGKELITGEKDGFHLSPQEKEDVENLFNSGYGLGGNRKRGLITQAKLSWKSLHIALRDLGLDESVKVDGNLIYTALHIPKDILSLEAKKTTYNNFKESMVSYIQNEMQTSLDAFCAVFQKLIEEDGLVLKGSYEHLSVMQFILIERYKVKEQLGKAITALRAAGLPDNEVLDLCGLDSNIQLREYVTPITNGNNGTENTSNTEDAISEE